MKRIKQLLLLCCLLVCGQLQAQTDYPYEYLYKNLPFSMPRVKAPAFPGRSVNLKDYGAVGDGSSLCTQAFAKAIDALSSKGGGKLVVPQGVWFTGPIVLKSNINLHLEKGAVILFSPDFSLYPLVKTVFEGLDTYRCQSPISGRNLTNVAITGEGVIDGNGDRWRPIQRNRVTAGQWKRLTSPGGVYKTPDYWYPSESALKGSLNSDMNVPRNMKSLADWQTVHDYLRPVMVSLIECRNVWLQGVIFQNSPAWNLHPLMCENVLVEDVDVRNPAYAANGDAIDLESCKNTIIVNSVFDAGDDGICIKSGKDADGRKRGRACENLLVDGCTVFRGHGGFVVGSEMSGGVKNMYVSNCQFLGTDVGLRFKSRRGRGGVVENIWIKNISMIDIVTEAIRFNLFYWTKGQKDTSPKPVDETTPEFRNIYIENVVCRNAGRSLYFEGLPEKPIDNIHLKNISISAKKDAVFQYCTNIKKENVKLTVEK